MKRLVLLLASALLTVGVLAADPRQPAPAAATPQGKPHTVAIIDMARVFRESKAALQIQAQFKAWQDGILAEVQPKIDQLKKEQAELQDPASKLSAADKEKKTKEMEALQQDLGQRQRQAQQEFQAKQQAAGAQLRSEVDPILDQLGKENGWDVILNKGEQTLWTADGVDQTDLLIQRLNAATPAPAQAPAAAPAAPKKP